MATAESLMPAVLQFLLQPLGLAAEFRGEGGAVAGQVAQVPDRLRGHERCLQQAALAQLAQPGRVGDIGFAPGQALGVCGVDQDHVQAVFEEVERPAPVVAGCFHDHQGDLFGDQPVTQLQERVGGGGERAGLLSARASPARAGGAYARF